MRIRSQLIVLTIAALLPVATFALFAVWQLAERERQAFKQSVAEEVINVSNAADAELRNAIGVLEALANSRALDRGDLRQFYEQAVRTARSQPHWSEIHLARPSGEQILNTLAPYGTALPPLLDTESLKEAREGGAPVVGNVVFGPIAQTYVVPVRLPVIRDGEVKYVITAAVDASAFATLLRHEHLPADWMAAVVDRAGKYVARNANGLPRTAELAPEHYRSQLGQPSARSSYIRTAEGARMYGSFDRSPLSGWVIGVGMPVAALNAGAIHALLMLGGGMAAAVGVALLLAWFLGRRIVHPIIKLAGATRALARGEDVELDLRRTSREVGELAAGLRGAAAAVRVRENSLREADRMKDEFLASLSHELRNPLAAIVGAGHVLRVARERPEALAQASDVIERQAAQMSRLVDDLLDVSRVTMGKAHVQRRPLDLAEETAKVLDALGAAGRARRHRIARDLRPAWVDADPARVAQIVANLVGNALKYTPEGGAIAVHVRREGDSSLLEVADNGEGFAPEFGARMFDVFVQGEQKLHRAQGGLGIGLALVRRLAELHGGTASAHSAGPGKGALFTVRLPAISPPVQAEPAPLADALAARTRRILLVEDNEDARRVLLLALTLDGHKVYEAADGKLALDLAPRVKPEVAVIDIGLPGLDGYEVAKSIRASEYGRGVFLIALTGYGQPADRQRALKAEFDVHLTKPVAPGQIEELLARLAA